MRKVAEAHAERQKTRKVRTRNETDGSVYRSKMLKDNTGQTFKPATREKIEKAVAK